MVKLKEKKETNIKRDIKLKKKEYPCIWYRLWDREEVGGWNRKHGIEPGLFRAAFSLNWDHYRSTTLARGRNLSGKRSSEMHGVRVDLETRKSASSSSALYPRSQQSPKEIRDKAGNAYIFYRDSRGLCIFRQCVLRPSFIPRVNTPPENALGACECPCVDKTRHLIFQCQKVKMISVKSDIKYCIHLFWSRMCLELFWKEIPVFEWSKKTNNVYIEKKKY